MTPLQAKSSTLPRQIPFSSRSPVKPQHRGSADLGRKHSHSHDENRMKLAALVSKKAAEEQLQIRIKSIQNTTAMAAMRFNAQAQQPIGEHDPGIIEGYLEDVLHEGVTCKHCPNYMFSCLLTES